MMLHHHLDYSYVFLPSLAGVIMLPSNLYALGPITDRNTARFFSPSVIVSRQKVSEAFCVLRPFLAAFLEFAHMTEL